MSFEEIQRMDEKKEDEYIDWTAKRIVQQPRREQQFIPQKRKIVYDEEEDYPLKKEPQKIEEPIIKPDPIKEKKVKRSIPLAFMIILLLVTGVSAYNFYQITINLGLQNARWIPTYDKCIEYYDQETFFKTFCDSSQCTFTYQNSEQTFTKSSIEILPSDHNVFCKQFKPLETMIRGLE